MNAAFRCDVSEVPYLCYISDMRIERVAYITLGFHLIKASARVTHHALRETESGIQAYNEMPAFITRQQRIPLGGKKNFRNEPALCDF
jgi:hypothetical protein